MKGRKVKFTTTLLLQKITILRKSSVIRFKLGVKGWIKHTIVETFIKLYAGKKFSFNLPI